MAISVWIVGTCFCSGHAQPRPTSGGKTILFIAGRNHKGPARKVAQAMRSHLTDLGVTFRVFWVPVFGRRLPVQAALARRKADQHRALGVFWCDFSTPGKVFLYLVYGSGRQVVVRWVTEADEGAYGKFDAMGVIARGIVKLLLQGRRVQVRVRVSKPGRPAPPGKTGPTVPARGVQSGTKTVHAARGVPSPERTSAYVGMAYRLDGFSSQYAVVHSGQVSVGVILHKYWSVELGYRFAPGVEVRTRPAEGTLRIDRHGVVLGAAVGWTFRWFRLGFQLGVELGLNSRGLRVDVEGMNASPKGVDVVFGVEAAIRAAFRVHRWMMIFLHAGASFVPYNPQYELETAGDRSTILRPWAVQPFGMSGVRFFIY